MMESYCDPELGFAISTPSEVVASDRSGGLFDGADSPMESTRNRGRRSMRHYTDCSTSRLGAPVTHIRPRTFLITSKLSCKEKAVLHPSKIGAFDQRAFSGERGFGIQQRDFHVQALLSDLTCLDLQQALKWQVHRMGTLISLPFTQGADTVQ